MQMKKEKDDSGEIDNNDNDCAIKKRVAATGTKREITL